MGQNRKRRGVFIQTALLFILLLAGLLPAGSHAAAACDCQQPKDAMSEMADSTAVFKGKVIKIEGSKVFFDVGEMWKGPKQHNVTVLNGQGDCAYSYLIGGEYVVYAKGAEIGPALYSCARSVSVRYASGEVQALGQPMYTLTVGGFYDAGQVRQLSTWYKGLAGALFLLMGLLVYRLVRRTNA